MSGVSMRQGANGGHPQGNFAGGWFDGHGGVPLDRRGPVEKLKLVKEKLQLEISDDQRGRLLMQQKTLAALAVGSSSVEYFDALLALAEFYNQRDQSQSAMRHLADAGKVRKRMRVPLELEFRYQLERAWALLNLHSGEGGDGGYERRDLLRALRQLEQCKDAAGEDFRSYRRDVCLARLHRCMDAFDEAVTLFHGARSHLPEETPEWAHLVAEIGDVCEMNGDVADALHWWKSAFDTYSQFGLTDDAQKLEPKISRAERKGSSRTEADGA